MKIKISITTILIMTLLNTVNSFGQIRADYFNKPGNVIVPKNYTKDKEYPVLIFLPYTTGTAEEFLNRHLDYIPLDDVIILIPQGRPVTEDYLPDFMSYISWYEERLLLDLENLFQKYSVDKSKIAIGGYSLGGDLSWALLIRNPSMFSGAVMAGTRTSYHTNKTSLSILKERGFRVAFFIGKNELEARYNGMQWALKEIKNSNIENYYLEVEGGHVSGPANTFAQKMLWAANIEDSSTTLPEIIDARLSHKSSGGSEITIRLENRSGNAIVYFAIGNSVDNLDRIIYQGNITNSPVQNLAREYVKTNNKTKFFFKVEGNSNLLESRPLQDGIRVVLEEDGRVRATYSDWGY